ncbi:glycosyltransferase family 2 protein [Listeria grandensis]|uniref:glycosyltransferase family 2 protein n=1 Tax=Listeria grandensis TaxID=1494963 RepID=UPI00164D1DF8|nr:glycosyltransferase family 2 protein [Listeria grandensis]MBC6315244.1 glycosyltransferase [Listeria grandensis]
MMRDLVSVVIPTRDRVKMLERAVASVLSQTYPAVEICIVIDGEDDVTKRFVQRYMDGEIPVKVLQTKGVGGSTARNLGVGIAAGKWIAFLDDDDEFLPDKLEKQLALLDENSEARHLAFTSVATYAPGKPKRTYQLPYIPWKEGAYSVGDYLFSRKSWKTIGFMQTSTLLIPRKILLEIPFTEGLKKHQDWDLLLRMEQAGVEMKHLASAETVYHQNVATAGRVGQLNAWTFSEKWMETAPLTRTARDSFLLSIVNRGIATDTSLTKWQRQKAIVARGRKVHWNIRYSGSYLYMLLINLIRVYSK